MKIEVEVTEAEIKSAIERKIRKAISDECDGWNADSYIKEYVKKHWKEVADKAIKDGLENYPVLFEKIQAGIEAKIKGQLNAILKVNK